MGLNKNQIDDIMKMVEGAGASKQKSLPSLAMPKKASDGLDSQIKNLDIRLGSIGQDTSQLKDPRNPIEKALNLTQDQNILFDLFEVINRPQQAIFGGIIAAQKGEDVGQGFMEGLTGKADEHYGGDIIRNTLGRTEDGKIDWTDFAGFALDIFLDPADLGLALVTGGASTIVSAVDAGADTTKLLKTGAKAKEAMDVARKSNALDMAQNVLLGKGNRLYVPDSVPEYLQIMFDKKYRQSLGIQTISVTDSIFRTGASGIKVGGAFADSIVETTLGKVDDELLQGYKHFKNQFSETMKSTAGGVRKAMTAARERILRGHDIMAVEFRDFDDAVKKYAEKTGKDLATANREILHLYEYMKLPEKNFTEYQFLKEVFDAKVPFFRYDDNTLKQLKEIFGEDIINESTKRATHAVAGHQFDVIEFDKNYWSMDNTDLADRFYEAENRSIRLLSEGETIKYENILRQKDPEAFATYEKLRKDFNNETLLQRIDLEYDNRFPYGTKKRHASLEDANKAKKKIEDSLRKRMVKEGVGAEAFLKDKVDFSEVADDIMDKQTMDFLKSDMDAETEYYYNLALKEDKRYIDMLVSKKYPTSNAPTDPVERVAYNKKRNKYAAELRASRSSFPYSEQVLKEAQEGTLQKEGLFQFKSAEDVKNFSGDVDSLPESMRKEFKALKKQGDTLQKVRESVTTDTLLEKSRKYKNAIKKYDDMAHKIYLDNFLKNSVADEGINPGLIDIFDESIYSIVDPIKLNENALYENNVEVVDGFDGIKKSGAILPDGRILSANEHEQIAKALTGDDNSIKVFKEKGITYFGLGERSFDRSVTIVGRPTQEQLKAIQSAFDSFAGGGGKFTVIFQLDDMEEIAKIDLPFAKSANLDLEIRKLMKKSPSLGGLDESIKAMQLPKTAGVKPARPIKIRPELSEPKINIKKWYTDEQIEAFEMLKKDTELLGMVDQFGNVIRKTQEIIGEVEFGDAQALVRRSMAGYAPHVQSAETMAIWDKIKKEATKKDVQGYFAPGNLRELSQRGYNMSTLEANNVKQMYNKAMWENDEWFQENVPDEMRDMVEEFFETDGFSESASESLLGLMNAKFTAINRNKRTTDMLIAMSMGDPDGKSSAIKYISDSEATPRGFERLREAEVRKLKKTLNETRELAGDGYYLNKLIHTAERGLNQGTEVVMEKHLYRMLNIMDKNPVTALNVLDKFHSLYKLLKTSNPISFNGKNFIGNNTNMWLSGIDVPDIVTNWNRAHDYVTKYTKQIKPLLASGGKLTDEQAKIAQYMEDMLQNGYFNLDSIYKLNDMEAIIEETIGEVGKKVRKNPLDNPLTNANMSANLWVDNHARMALYIYAKENPEYLAKLGFDPLDPKSAMNAVRMVLFDPKDLSLWEEDWMKRLIPFYTFTRQNLAFQVKNIAKNSSRYYKMYKGLNSVYNASDIDVDDVNSFERTQFYLPVFGQKDGKYVAVKTSVPFAALMEFGEDPAGRFVGSTSPVIKGVFEKATGSSAFTGRPIENYEGEPSTNIPGSTKMNEWYMSQVGVDIPARTAGGLVDLVKNLIKGEDPTQSLSRATGMFYAGDIEKAKMAKQYEKLNALNDRVKTLKAQGQAVPTLSEITASISKPESSDKMAQMKQIMDMIKQTKR